MLNQVFSVPLVPGTSPGGWSCFPADRHRDFSATLKVEAEVEVEAEALSFKPHILPGL